MWSKFNYTYTCCDCPAGYIAVASSCTDTFLPYEEFCVGCTAADETLHFNSSSLSYSCQGPSLQQELCKVLNAVSTGLNALGLLSTWVGLVCATTDLKSVAITLLEDADSIMSAIASPSSGFLGTKFSAASAVVSTISSFLLGAAVVVAAEEALPIAGALAETYLAVCDVNNAIRPLLFLDQSAAQAVIDNGCKQTKSKR
jgi:hypothetical protein